MECNKAIYIAVCIVKEQPAYLLRYEPSENIKQVWSKLQSKVKNMMKLLHDVDFVFAWKGMDIAIKEQGDLVTVIRFARENSITPIPLRVLSTCGETSASAAVSSVSKGPPSLSPSTSTGVPTKKRRFSLSNASGIASELEQAFQHASHLQSQIEEHRLTGSDADKLRKLELDLDFWKGQTRRLEKKQKQLEKKQKAQARQRAISEYENKSKGKQFKRPTPKPKNVFRSSYRFWPTDSKRPIVEGFPSRDEIVGDHRCSVLGIGNGFGTGKTELALSSKFNNKIRYCHNIRGNIAIVYMHLYTRCRGNQT